MFMTTFMDRVAESGRWAGPAGHDLDASSDALPGENAPLPTRKSRSLGRDALLASIVRTEILPRLARLRRQAAPALSPLTTDDDTQAFVHLLLNQDAAASV